MIRIRPTARVLRAAVLSAAVAGAGTVGLLGTAGAAHASSKPDGYVTVATCGALTGNISYSPALLTSTAQNTTATLNGLVSNCNTEGQGQLSGFGTMTATMSGSASVASENFSGSLTIDWPAPLSPSTGTLYVSDSSGTEQVDGSISSGPYTGDEFGYSYVITSEKGKGTTAKPVTSQAYINDASLIVQENDG
jgi:hypothetical protein